MLMTVYIIEFVFGTINILATQLPAENRLTDKPLALNTENISEARKGGRFLLRNPSIRIDEDRVGRIEGLLEAVINA